MGEAGRQTVQQRFDWPVVARLHHQLYAELAERRCAGQECSGLKAQHPLRGDPFRDFAPFATACLGPETELRLAMPLPELQHRLSNLTSLDRAMGSFMPAQQMCSGCWFSSKAREAQSLSLSFAKRLARRAARCAAAVAHLVGETGLYSLVSPPGSAMTQAENPYRQDVFLEDLRQQKDRQQQRIWAEHQQMQLSFLRRRGLTASSTVLDIGCGPMRLGSALFPCSTTAGITGRTSTLARSPLVRRCCVRLVFRNRLPTPCLPPTSSSSPRLIGRCRSLLPIRCSAISRSIRSSRPCCSCRPCWPQRRALCHVLRAGARSSLAFSPPAQQVGTSV